MISPYHHTMGVTALTSKKVLDELQELTRTQNKSLKNAAIVLPCEHLVPLNNLLDGACQRCLMKRSLIVIDHRLLNATAMLNYNSISKVEYAILNTDLNLLEILVQGDKRLLHKEFQFSNNDNISLINFAVKTEKLSVVRYLVDKGVNIRQIDAQGYTLLHRACENVEITKFLLKKGLDPSITSQDGRNLNALGTAVYSGDFEVFKTIFEHDRSLLQDVDCENIISSLPSIHHGHLQITACLLKIVEEKDFMFDKNYLLFLHNECAFSNFDVIKKELSHIKRCLNDNVSFIKFINNSNEEGKTLLHSACLNGDKKTIEYLLNQGADIYADDTVGSTPLELLLEYNDTIEQTKLLISKIPSSKINKPLFNGNIAIALANKYSNLELFVELLNKGAYIDNTSNQTNFISNGSTISAKLNDATSSNIATKKPLERKKVSFNENVLVKTFNEEFPVTSEKNTNLLLTKLFAHKDSKKLLKTLIKQTADINQPLFSNDISLLAKAIECDNVKAVAQLVKAGANIIHRDGNNKTPLDIAFAKYQATGNVAMLDTLLGKTSSSNIDQSVCNNETLLISAIRSKNPELTTYLVNNKGASYFI